MKLLIIETNFYNDQSWIFKLTDDSGFVYFIPDSLEYQRLGITSPISKRHVDSYDKGHVIDAEYIEISGKKIVITITD